MKGQNADGSVRADFKEDLHFRGELERLINKFSRENGSDTPDFILAEYLTDCLDAFDKALQRREAWYDRKIGSWNINIPLRTEDDS